MSRFFEIFAVTVDGVHVKLFTWTRDEASGIARAKHEAAAHGYSFVDVYAVARDAGLPHGGRA